jgi:hypothetical protein
MKLIREILIEFQLVKDGYGIKNLLADWSLLGD